MLDIHDLERRWLRYKIKCYMPVFFSTFAVLVVFVLGIVFIPEIQDNQKPEKAKLKKDTVLEKNNSVITVAKNTLLKPVVKKSQQEQSLLLKPSLDFMNNIEKNISPYNERKQFCTSNKKTEQKPQQVKKKKPEKEKLKITVNKNSDEEDLKDVIKRFKKNKNPALSLFIAKKYYKSKQYKKSYNYALMTNEIDKTIEDSWIIFSKSLVKLGKKELAIKTLKSYLKTTNSTSAKILLRKINTGEFK